MAYVAVDKDTKEEYIYDSKPKRCLGFWKTTSGECVKLPKGGYIENSHVYAGVIKC